MTDATKIEVGELKKILEQFDDGEEVELYIAEGKYEIGVGLTVGDGDEILYASMLNMWG